MKKTLLICTVLGTVLLGLMFGSCKKKSDSAPAYACASCVTAPEAVAANDNSSKGIYKGIIVGSSGTIKFDIMNNDSTIKAYMVIDGVADTLTSSVSWTSGVAFVAPFTGTLSGQPVSITVSIDANGGNPVVTAMSIPGHPNAQLTLSKETSTDLIQCFEGTYTNATTGKNGTFDLILSKKLEKWSAQSRENGATASYPVDGTLSGSTLSFNDGDVSGTATLTTDEIVNGSWHNSTENGTWTAKRTL